MSLLTSRVLLTTLVISCIVPATSDAAIRYVDAGATGTATGTSWADAFVNLQDALVSASAGTEIWVAEGSYAPDRGTGQVPGSRASTFNLRPGVGIYGGFAGTEATRAERNPAAHVTVLTGDLQGNDQPAWVNHGDNAHHVVSASGVDSTAVLDGFTVYGGYAETASGWDTAAGGLLVINASPLVASCRFHENLAHSGGALGTFPGSPRVRACRFEGNYAWTGRGGAAYHDAGSNPVYADCMFLNNDAWGGSAVGDGGAMFNSSGTAVRMERCTFTGNTSTAVLAIYSNGGAIANLGDGMVVVDCAFHGNDALTGGGVWTGGDATFVNTIFTGNHSLFGGGMVIFNAIATIVNSDFSLNDAPDGGGVALGFGGRGIFRNSILWGNTASGAPSLFKAQVHKGDDTATTSFRYSAIQGVFTPEPGEDPPDPANFPGCTEANPLFRDANGTDNIAGTADDDLHLMPGSPCIDGAENATVPAWVVMDRDGMPRFFNDPCTVDHGLGTPPLVDMGAFEFPTSSCTDVAALGPGSAGSTGGATLAKLSVVPSPFAGECRVRFRVMSATRAGLEVFDAAGRRVRVIEPRRLAAGEQEFAWDGRDDRGRRLAAGLYFIRVGGDVAAPGKVILAPDSP